MTWERWIFREYETSARSLGIFRIVFALMTLVLVLPQAMFVPAFPSSFFSPPLGPMMLFVGFPDAWFFHLLALASILCTVGVLFGYRTSAASLGLAACLLVGSGWRHAFGAINHDILFVLTPALLSFAGWGRAYSLDARGRAGEPADDGAWVLSLLALLIALAMLTGAVPKAAGGWLDPGRLGVRFYLAYSHFMEQRQSIFSDHLLRVRSLALWKALDVGTVLLEAAFIVSVTRRRRFRIVCALATIFHFANALLLKITFWYNLGAYAAFVDWEAMLRVRPVAVLERRIGPLVTRLTARHLVATAAVLFGVYEILGNPVERLVASFTASPAVFVGQVVCAIGCLAGVTFLVRESAAVWRER